MALYGSGNEDTVIKETNTMEKYLLDKLVKSQKKDGITEKVMNLLQDFIMLY